MKKTHKKIFSKKTLGKIWGILLLILLISLFSINNEILKVLLLLLIGNSLLAYRVINPPIDKEAKLSPEKQAVVVRIIFLWSILMLLYGFSPFFADVFNYLKHGENYLKKETCIVEREFKLPVFFFAKKKVVCKNNNKYFQKFITFDSYLEDEVFVFYYLPKSKIIMKEKLIHSPNEKKAQK